MLLPHSTYAIIPQGHTHNLPKHAQLHHRIGNYGHRLEGNLFHWKGKEVLNKLYMK